MSNTSLADRTGRASSQQFSDAVPGWLPRIPMAYLALALGLLFGTGLLQGYWTERWHASAELSEATARLDAVPLTVGDWQGVPAAVDAQMVARAGLERCWMRQYTSALSGERITVLLMCGRAGPASVHTPEICYGGAGYRMTAGPGRRTLALAEGAPAAEFWTAQFTRSDTLESTDLRIYWSWSAAGQWQAPDYPRLTFASRAALYKLYVLHNVNASAHHSDGPVLEFMPDFLAQLNETLFPVSAR
jgi:hypothetical protein